MEGASCVYVIEYKALRFALEIVCMRGCAVEIRYRHGRAEWLFYKIGRWGIDRRIDTYGDLRL